MNCDSPLISVVVVNLNRAELLRDCINSLLGQAYDRFEVLVVDNGSNDESCDVVRSLQDPRLRLIMLDQNLGFAGGCNRGFEEARGDFIALLNNDAVARPDWLTHLIEPMLQDPSLGMCASKILFWDSDVIDKAGHLIYFDGQNRGRGTGETDRGQYDRVQEALFPDGCAALYRGELIRELEGFDEDFFAYGDDADLGVRARLLGWNCLYIPRAVVFHHHSSTTGRFSLQKIYWVERNRFWLLLKSFPLFLVLLSPLFTVSRFFWNLIAFIQGRGSAGTARGVNSGWGLLGAVLRAYVDGLRELPAIFEKRRKIRRERRLSDIGFWRLLWRFRISARDLAFKERR